MSCCWLSFKCQWRGPRLCPILVASLCLFGSWSQPDDAPFWCKGENTSYFYTLVEQETSI